MKKNSISIIFLLFASLFLLISTGCGTSESTSGSDRTGILNLEIVNKHSNSKIILPDIDMTPASYVINGTGPDGATFTVDSSETQVSVIELAFGTWALSVEGYNAAGTRIALGAGTAEVHTGETTNTDITVTPLTGNGTLNFVLTWEAADTETPSIESQLTSSDGTTQDLAFVITNGDTGTCTNDTLPAGYYALSVKLLDNGIYTMGAVEIIRIVEGAVTTGTIDFPEINKPGGTIDINITSDMQEPIDVSLSAVPETIASDAAVDVTASVPDGTGDVFHTWYVNGNFAAAGSTANPSYTITASALKLDGSYRLDVVTFSANGKRAGSKSASFTIAENIIPVVKYSHVFDISAGNPQIGNADIDDMMGTRTLSTYDLSAETQDGKAVWVNPYGARYPGDGLGAIYISHCPVNSKSELTFQLSNNSEETKVGLYSRAKNFSESAANENFLNAGVTFGTDVVVANNGYTHNLGASASWVNVECKITVKQVNQYVRVELYKNGILKYQSNVILPNAIVANVNDSFIVPYLKKNIYIKKVEFMDQAEVPFDPEYTGGETGDPVGTPYAETAANWQYSHLFNEGADEPLDVSGAEINTGNLHALQSIYGNSRLDSYGLVLDNTAAPDIIAISNSPVNLHSESIFKFTGNGNFCHVIRGQADQSSFLVAGSRLRDEQVWLYIQDHTGTSLHEYDVCEASANGSEWLNQECRIVVDFVNDKARVKLYKNDVLEGKIEHSLDDPSSFQGTSSGIYLESNVAVKQYRFSEETTEPFEPATLVYGTENNDNPDYGNTLMYHDFTASPDGLLSSALPQQRNAAFSFYVWMQPTFELPHDVNGEDWTVPSILSGSGIVGMEDGFAGQVLSEVSDCIIELEFQLPEGEQDKDLSLCLWFRGGYGFWYFEKIKTYCLLFPGEGIDYVVITEGHPLYDTSVLNKMKVRLEGDTVTYYANDIQLGQASPGIDEAVDDPRMHGLAGGFCTGVFYKSYRISPLE